MNSSQLWLVETALMKMIDKRTGKKKERGRPLQFNREELVARVMELFWERGYNNLSLSEIAKETGVTRASLYNAFGSKEGLFLEAVRHYTAHSADASLLQVKAGDPVGPVFYRMFHEAIRTRAKEKRRGCLAINCLSELIASNRELGGILAGIYNERIRLIKGLINQAIRNRELPEGTEPEVTANMIQTFITGFSIFSKREVSEGELLMLSHAFLEKIGFAVPETKPPGRQG